MANLGIHKCLYKYLTPTTATASSGYKIILMKLQELQDLGGEICVNALATVGAVGSVAHKKPARVGVKRVICCRFLI
jgi:hypothetical protein